MLTIDDQIKKERLRVKYFVGIKNYAEVKACKSYISKLRRQLRPRIDTGSFRTRISDFHFTEPSQLVCVITLSNGEQYTITGDEAGRLAYNVHLGNIYRGYRITEIRTEYR